ncbi:MAG: acyl carrier protein [Planctomycetales bacterium]|nr:acyl carrier protein [Planctomycetales bacterium]
MTDIDVRTKVAEVINKVLVDSGRPAIELEDEDILTETVGLDSLDLAVLVVGLEQSLGIDPFREGASPVPTFGELCKVYQDRLAK